AFAACNAPRASVFLSHAKGPPWRPKVGLNTSFLVALGGPFELFLLSQPMEPRLFGAYGEKRGGTPGAPRVTRVATRVTPRRRPRTSADRVTHGAAGIASRHDSSATPSHGRTRSGVAGARDHRGARARRHR